MFMMVFKWRVAEERKADFAAAWREVTLDLLEEGSHGSALFEAGDGSLVALPRWPDKAARDAATARVGGSAAWTRMVGLVDALVQADELDERINLWAPYPPPDPQEKG